jgi:hypothetical protein
VVVVSAHVWLYNGFPVNRDPRLPDPTAEAKRDLALHLELRNRENITDPTDPIALARRLWDQIATRHMEALDARSI